MKKLGDYQVIEKLSETVFRTEKGLDNYVLKEVPGPKCRERRIHEKFDHPNIVKMYDCIYNKAFWRPAHYLVLEDIKGDNMIKCKIDGLFDRIDFYDAAMKMTDAVDYVHEQGFLHNDIKPFNWVHNEDDVKLIDFGSACKIGDSDSVRMGTTYGWRSKEARDNMMEEASDVFSLGCVFYYIKNGMSPFLEWTNSDVWTYQYRESHFLQKGPKGDIKHEPLLDELVKSMVEFKKGNRPSIKEVRDNLDSMITRFG